MSDSPLEGLSDDWRAPRPGYGSGPESSPAAPPPDGPDFDRIERNLRTAGASYVIPEKMVAGESSHVHLDLSFQKTLDELRDELERHLPGAKIETAAIRCSTLAQVRLTGQHFQIAAITPEEQPVGSGTTTWEWEVTPLAGGHYPLHLSVDAVVTMGADVRKWTLNTFEKSVVVRVSVATRIKEFTSSNWQWMWATLVAPVGGWVWLKRRKTRRPARHRRSARAASDS